MQYLHMMEEMEVPLLIISQLNKFECFSVSTHCIEHRSLTLDTGVSLLLMAACFLCHFCINSSLSVPSEELPLCGQAEGMSTNASSLHLSPSLVAQSSRSQLHQGSRPKSHMVLSRNWTLREQHESNWPYKLWPQLYMSKLLCILIISFNSPLISGVSSVLQ